MFFFHSLAFNTMIFHIVVAKYMQVRIYALKHTKSKTFNFSNIIYIVFRSIGDKVMTLVAFLIIY